jgi:predicted  nucleic acid-binding Zn-ribbon protein
MRDNNEVKGNCPECGSGLYAYPHTPSSDHPELTMYYIECTNEKCGYKDPEEYTPEEITDKWLYCECNVGITNVFHEGKCIKCGKPVAANSLKMRVAKLLILNGCPKCGGSGMRGVAQTPVVPDRSPELTSYNLECANQNCSYRAPHLYTGEEIKSMVASIAKNEVTDPVKEDPLAAMLLSHFTDGQLIDELAKRLNQRAAEMEEQRELARRRSRWA